MEAACSITRLLARYQVFDCIFQKAPWWLGDHFTSAFSTHTQHSQPVYRGGGKLFFKERKRVSHLQMSCVMHEAGMTVPSPGVDASSRCQQNAEDISWGQLHESSQRNACSSLSVALVSGVACSSLSPDCGGSQPLLEQPGGTITCPLLGILGSWCCLGQGPHLTLLPWCHG